MGVTEDFLREGTVASRALDCDLPAHLGGWVEGRCARPPHEAIANPCGTWPTKCSAEHSKPKCSRPDFDDNKSNKEWTFSQAQC